MKVRSLLTLTALVSSILGAIAVYLVLTVPNDLKADSLLKSARQDLTAGKTDAARTSLSQIVQQYPRTDAAAAATVALMRLDDEQRDNLQKQLAQLRTENAQQTKLLADLQKSVETIRRTPPPAPPVVTAPPAKKTPPKRVTKKPTPKRKTTTRRRR